MAEIYRPKASGFLSVISSFRAWMPSKMATSLSPSLRRVNWLADRFCLANIKYGILISLCSRKASKCSFKRSISSIFGLSKSMSPSGVRGTVFGSIVLK